MTKAQALAQVAEHAAGLLQAGDFEEATGVHEADVTQADRKRLNWAVEQVVNRLYRMGQQTTTTAGES